MSRLALMIDLERCTGCKSCEAACKQANGLGPHEYRNRVLWLQDAQIPRLDFLTVTCQQCERPACLRACPVQPKALTREPETGVVSVDESRCTGCGECVLACPYGAMGYDPIDHHAVKCDLCATRRASGGGPACESVCPTRAISFGERDELLERAEHASRTSLDHDHFMQGPATIYLNRLEQNSAQSELARSPAVLIDNSPRRAIDGMTSGTGKTASTSADEATEITPGGCHICFNACTVKYHRQGQRIVNVFGNDEDPIFEGRVCPKSQMTLQLYDNADRLTQPLKRVGQRGEGRFEPIGWDQALDEIAERLTKLRDEYGPETLALQAGTRTGVLNIIGFMPMFARLWGTPNVATTEPYCDIGKVVALQLTLGSTNLPNVYTEDDIGSASLYVYIGDNQAETRPVNFGLVNGWRLNNGAGMVVVDPRLTATASKADKWLAIRPGTDMALGLALIHHILEHALYDETFCATWIEGFAEWRDFILDRGYSPQWATSVTDLAASDIAELAQRIAGADGCMVFASRGVNQHTNSCQTNRVFMFLCAISGNFGAKGGGYFNVSAEPDWMPIALPPEAVTEPSRPAVSKTPSGWLPAMTEHKPYPIRAMITGNNPLAQWPDQNASREALSRLDLLVHIELFHNETSMMADYVLPAATGVEKGGISRLSEDRRIVWNDKLIDPPGQARSDHWIWIELGKRLGFANVLKDEYKDPGVFWDEVFRPATPDLNGVTLARLRAAPHRWVRTPVAHEDDPEPATLYLEGTTAFNRPEGQRFPTGSGKLEFWTPSLEEKFAAIGLSALPEFYTDAPQLQPLPVVVYGTGEPDTLSPFYSKPVYTQVVTVSQADERDSQPVNTYDTELITGRPPAPHFHSWTHYFWQAQEMWPDLYCQMHPDKASRIGVKDGERVRIESPAGEIEARAWITPGIRPSAVFVPIGWGEQQPYNPWKPVNFLTGIAMDPVSQQPNLKSHLCRLSAVTG